MIRQFDGISPNITESGYVDPDAVIIGDVVMGGDGSVWPLCARR